jgi:protein-disulfide isomerase
VEDNIFESERREEGFLTLRFKKDQIVPLLVLIALAVGLSIGYLLWGNDPVTVVSAADPTQVVQESILPTQTAQEQAIPPQATQDPTVQSAPIVTRYDVSIDDDPVLGSDTAPITLIEFSDFECPYCTKWHNEVFEPLMESYGDQIRFVYRDFPLNQIHSEAQPAAEAANCANEQGKYWAYHDLLFKGGTQALNSENYIRYAEELDLDIDDFKECIESNRYVEEIMADHDEATKLGVRSTPTFFINGMAVVGAQPFEVFKRIIDKELAGEIP